jgi:hypothetical protein
MIMDSKYITIIAVLVAIAIASIVIIYMSGFYYDLANNPIENNTVVNGTKNGTDVINVTIPVVVNDTVVNGTILNGTLINETIDDKNDTIIIEDVDLGVNKT